MKNKILSMALIAALAAGSTAWAGDRGRDRHYAQPHSHHSHGMHRSHRDRNLAIGILGGLAIGTIIANSQPRYYYQAQPPVVLQHNDPSRVCAVREYHSGRWVDVVETNCYGEVIRRTRRYY